MSRWLVLFSIILLGCKPSEDEWTPTYEAIPLMTIPQGFPEMKIPEDNAFTQDRWELGKLLFHDKRLSKDNTISCASCHKQEFGFSDNVPKTNGAFKRIGVRNSPSLINIGFHPYFLREGGVPTLEMQILVPIQEHNEFAHNVVDIVEELSTDQELANRSKEAYDRDFDAFVLTRAIANYERSIIGGRSKYDLAKQVDAIELNEVERRGKTLFFSERTNCSHCHSGYNFTDYSFSSNGIYESYPDPGKMRVTKDSADWGKFKVPSLRNIAVTAPYMFDGSFSTLEEVVDHYNSGGKSFVNQDEKVRPLNLSNMEKASLVAFLRTLTDEQIIKDSRFVVK